MPDGVPVCRDDTCPAALVLSAAFCAAHPRSYAILCECTAYAATVASGSCQIRNLGQNVFSPMKPAQPHRQHGRRKPQSPKGSVSRSYSSCERLAAIWPSPRNSAASEECFYNGATRRFRTPRWLKPQVLGPFQPSFRILGCRPSSAFTGQGPLHLLRFPEPSRQFWCCQGSRHAGRHEPELLRPRCAWWALIEH